MKKIINLFFILFLLFFSFLVFIEYSWKYINSERFEDFLLNQENEINLKILKEQSNKDILIILDDFKNGKFNDHGTKISSSFIEYYFKYAKENNGKSIKTIFLSFINEYDNLYRNYDNVENDIREMNCFDLMEQKKYRINISDEYEKNNFYFKQITETCHSLESYLKMIRESNPNSKIVLSMSFSKLGQYLYLKELGKKYNIQYTQAYFNNFDRWSDIFMYFYHYIFTNQIEPLYVTNTKHKPLFYDKQVSIKDLNLKLEEKYYDENDYSTSYLTPILAYEYFLNDGKNILKTK